MPNVSKAGPSARIPVLVTKIYLNYHFGLKKHDLKSKIILDCEGHNETAKKSNII